MSRLYVGRVNITENDAQPTTSAPTAPPDPGAVALMVRQLPEPAVEATATESSQRGVLRRVLGKQSLVPVKVERLLKAYRQMPDEYHNHGDTPLSATELGTKSCMQKLGLSSDAPARLWEWFAGSGRLSATARKTSAEVAYPNRVSVLQPLDHRWGHDLNEPGVQASILWCLMFFGSLFLFAAPTCTPWSANSRVWPITVREQRRGEERMVLRFLALACLVQHLLGRGFMVENPVGSALWAEFLERTRHLQLVTYSRSVHVGCSL